MRVYIVGKRRGIRPDLSGGEAFERMLDATPRLPSPHIQAIDARREQRERAEARKAPRRARYLRRMKSINRRAQNGNGEQQ